MGSFSRPWPVSSATSSSNCKGGGLSDTSARARNRDVSCTTDAIRGDWKGGCGSPAATVTLDGTVATVVLLLESWMVIPVGGAVPLRVTVPVDGLPPTTFDGFNFNEESVGSVIVNVAVFVTPL